MGSCTSTGAEMKAHLNQVPDACERAASHCSDDSIKNSQQQRRSLRNLSETQLQISDEILTAAASKPRLREQRRVSFSAFDDVVLISPIKTGVDDDAISLNSDDSIVICEEDAPSPPYCPISAVLTRKQRVMIPERPKAALSDETESDDLDPCGTKPRRAITVTVSAIRPMAATRFSRVDINAANRAANLAGTLPTKKRELHHEHDQSAAASTSPARDLGGESTAD